MKTHLFEDIFGPDRSSTGLRTLKVGGELIPMILDYKAVREAAKDWQTFSSDAPYRVPIPSEEKERKYRQLPIETDPPQHKQYRDLLLPFFRRPVQPEYLAKLVQLIKTLLSSVAHREIDIVTEFALPLQCHSLAMMLGVSQVEAEIWQSWGTHVFRDGDDPEAKGSVLDQYLSNAIEKASRKQNENNFFSAMSQFTIDNHLLSKSEKMGISNLVFAGGRDTVINSIATIMAYFAEHPGELASVAATEKTVNLAVEEFVRALSPLAHIGRVCPKGAALNDHKVAENERVSLCWAAANFDPNIFDAATELQLDRSPNPHVGFGSAHHNCLGAPQARAIMRSLIKVLSKRKANIQIQSYDPNFERFCGLKRQVGYERLKAIIEFSES